MDHGHRCGQDHFVIVLVWSGYDSKAQPTYKYRCLSVDSAGHSAEDASKALKRVLKRSLDPETEVFVATADSGGGGAIQHCYPEWLVNKLDVMKEDSKDANCAIHGIQKSLENASKLAMGDQGLGVRSPFQMLFVFSKLMSEIRKVGGKKLLDKLWAAVNDQFHGNEEWEQYAKANFTQAVKVFMDKVDSFDENIEEEIDDLIKFLNKAPTGIQKPVWTRWASVSFMKCSCILILTKPLPLTSLFLFTSTF